MSQPNGEPAPGAPIVPAPTAPGAPANTPPANTGPSATDPVDVASLPANVQALIAQVRQEAGANRQGKTAAEQKATAAEQRLAEVLKVLGVNPDGTAVADPEAAAAALAERTAQAESNAWGALVGLEVYKAAGRLGADADALLDSNKFVNSLDEMIEQDPNSAEFKTALEAKITAALAANPNLKTKGSAGPTNQGADITGSGGNGTRPKGLAAAIKAQMGL